MKNNNQKSKKIYDKVQKKWYVVPNEFYKAYDRLCNTTRKRMQYQGRCECNKSKWWLCDARCLDCEFYISPTESLDAPILSDDGATNATLMDFVPDPRALPEKFAADCDLLEYLCARLEELFAEEIILAPYLQALKRVPDDDSLKRIQKLHTLITQNSEKRETLAKLLSQGVIGPVIYNKGLNELLSQYDTYQKEMNALKHSISDSLNHVSETTRLLRFAEKSSPLTAFDETLFEQFVDSILIRSRDEICYVLKCGLTLTERRQ